MPRSWTRLGRRELGKGRRLWHRAHALRFEDNIGFCAGCNLGAETAARRLLPFVNINGAVENRPGRSPQGRSRLLWRALIKGLYAGCA